jgi:hypothetical protein
VYPFALQPGPGEGLFPADWVFASRNQTGGTLEKGQAASFDIRRTVATTNKPGEENSIWNTLINYETASVLEAYIPACIAEEDIPDGALGLVRVAGITTLKIDTGLGALVAGTAFQPIGGGNNDWTTPATAGNQIRAISVGSALANAGAIEAIVWTLQAGWGNI